MGRSQGKRVLVAGDVFGLATVVLNPREAPLRHMHTATTKEPTWLLVLSQSELKASVPLRLAFKVHTAAKAECSLMAERLSTFTVFQDVSHAKMLQLAALISYVELPTNDYLHIEGQISDRFCLLWQGSVRITKTVGGQRMRTIHSPQVTLAEINAESDMPYFGENSILSSSQFEEPAGASVQTMEPCQLFVIYRENAGNFLKLLPEFRRLLHERKEMLRRTNQRLVNCQFVLEGAGAPAETSTSAKSTGTPSE